MKKIFNILLAVIIFILFSILVFSYSTKKILVNMISGSFTQSQISGKILDYIYDEVPELSINELGNIENKIKNNPVINKITDKYLDGIIKSILNNTEEKVDVSDEIKGLIDSITINIDGYDDANLKNKISNINLDNAYKSALYAAKTEMNSKLNILLNIYRIIENTTFITMISILLIINIIILFLVNKSLLDTLKIVSIVSIIFGFIGSVIVFVINRKMYYITNILIGRSTRIDINILGNISLICVILGSIINVLIYFKRKKESKI